MADYLNIAGRVRTTASDGVAMEAQEVKDLNQNKSQQEINADVQTELGDRYTKEETYSKEQLNELITTPDVNYVSVVATNATTAVTDILPATGEANNIYRVGNWNGTQYDPTMYALYAWNGLAYVCLAVRSFVGEVYDVSVNHPDGQGNPTPYANLSAALGTGGANIPVDIRRGGMSIKFIQGSVSGSDNKYVQYFLTKDSWSASEADWQKMNLEEEVSQLGQKVDDLFVVTDADLDLGDGDGNVVARFNGGHIKTLNFDSKDIVDKDIFSMPNKIDALSVNIFQLDTEHTYNLLNPSDFDGLDSGFIPISPENGTIIHMHFLEYVYYDRATKSTQNITINPFSTFCRFYDSNKDIISVVTDNTYQKAIPTNAAFVKVRLIDAKYRDVAWLSYDYTTATYSRGGIEHREYPKELGFTKTGYEDFTIVCFGDSITQGIQRAPLNISYVSYLEDILHCHTINVGFGGTRMAYVGASPLLSFANLADVIVSDAADKWDALDDYVGDSKHLNNLKNIDWNKVDAISVFYGMNDYAYQGSGTQIGEDGTMDKTTFNGACAYGLDKLLTKYPWLQVILITPYDRYFNDTDINSSNTANSVGKYMKDYADSLVGVQNMFRCPILDFYRESNINKYSYKTMMNDGVHAYVYPTVKRLAKMLAEFIMNKLY